MKKEMLLILLSQVIEYLGEELLERLLDEIEDIVKSNDNKIDDALILPVCKVLRNSLHSG